MRRPQARGEPSARAGERVGGGCQLLPRHLRGGKEQTEAANGGGVPAPEPLHHSTSSVVPLPAEGGEELSAPSACSTGPKRSTSFTRRPKACRGGSCGGVRCTTSRAPKGPERIAPEWWRQPSTARLRDYYRVEDAQRPPLLDLSRRPDRRRPRRRCRAGSSMGCSGDASPACHRRNPGSEGDAAILGTRPGLLRCVRKDRRVRADA